MNTHWAFGKAFATTAVSSLLLACGAKSAPPLHEFRDEGQLCLLPSSQADPSTLLDKKTFVAGEPIVITVTTQECFSSSCSEDQQASCAVQLVDATTLRVTSQGSFRDTTSQHEVCTSDCGYLTARCSTPALAAGSYTVLLGTEQMSITIPSTTSAQPCGGGGGSTCLPSYISWPTSAELPGSHGPGSAYPASEKLMRVTTVGGCTAACGSYATNDPDPSCDYVRVDAVAAGPCTVQAEMGNGALYEAKVRVVGYAAGSPCTGLYVEQDSTFVMARAGAPYGGVDAGACITNTVTFNLRPPAGASPWCMDWCPSRPWLTIRDSSGAVLALDSLCRPSCDTCQVTTCGLSCPPTGPAGPNGATQTWDGTFFELSRCGPANPDGMLCADRRCATAGRYTAVMCATPPVQTASDPACPSETPTCVEVPFDYPAAAPVVGTLP